MLEIFQQIAKEENGDLYINNERYSAYLPTVVMGAVVYSDTYQLSFEYKKHTVLVKNELGAHNVGTLNCILNLELPHKDFVLTPKGFWYKIASKSGQMGFTIKTDDAMLKRFLEGNTTLLQLSEIVRRSGFEPFTTGKDKGRYFELHTQYHLQFEQRTLVPRPLIQFYKELIDYLWI